MRNNKTPGQSSLRGTVTYLSFNFVWSKPSFVSTNPTSTQKPVLVIFDWGWPGFQRIATWKNIYIYFVVIANKGRLIIVCSSLGKLLILFSMLYKSALISVRKKGTLFNIWAVLAKSQTNLRRIPSFKGTNTYMYEHRGHMQYLGDHGMHVLNYITLPLDFHRHFRNPVERLSF